MSGTTTLARAWAVARTDGLTLGFTDHDAVLEFQSLTFRPQSGMSARAVMQSSGLSVDNSEIGGMLSDDAITEADLIAGRWDGAELRVWEVDWTDPENRRLLFRGHLGEITRQGSSFRAEMRGLSEALNKPNGWVFHRRCAAVLGDMACKVDLDAPGYRTEASVVAIMEEGARFRLAPVAGFDAGWFEHGMVDVLDGEAAGLHGVIKRDTALEDGGREVELWGALTATLAVGDRLRLTAGCDRRAETCRLKFDNFLNFRGFPHLPSEDWLTAPTTATDRASGGGARAGGGITSPR